MSERLHPNSSANGFTKTPMVGFTFTPDAVAETTVTQTITQP
jgi:hypothetical protein